MFTLKFFDWGTKKWNYERSASNFEWLRETALDLREVMNVSLKIVDGQNNPVGFFTRFGVR